MAISALLLSLGVVIASINTPSPTLAEVTTYKERSYGEIVDYLLELETKYPDYAEVFSVQDKYKLPKLQELNCTRASKTVPCENYVIKVTDESTLPKPERPELIFSGVVHGTNESARSHNVRRELNVDPNRDFPYNIASNRTCMATMAARALNELWRDHLFQLGITFHAGRECITYEWGAKNHVMESGKSHKSPDDRSQQQLSRIMSRFGGKFEDSGEYYPDGTMNDVEYPMDGGMEDWGYAASWENEFTTPKPIRTCNPTSYGGYPSTKTEYNNATHRAFNVLIETSNSKQPNATSFGDSSSLSDESLRDYLPETDMIGHIPRNVRLSLLYIDMVQPYVLWKTHPHTTAVKKATAFKWEVAGAITVDNTQLKIWSDNPANATLIEAQKGVTRWYHKDLGSKVNDNNKGFFSASVKFPAAGTYYVQAVATVDQDWATQGTGEDIPVPMVKPQTHIVNARTNDDWLYSNNGRVVQGQKVWKSQVKKIVVA
ncbi:unnamed protein product [Phytophthora fragariaefolia]|uniref:Unnamed protein product n=1 Tax=Phytophthora fragariaefolia TaxID=1490495 RepID=A0A9W6XIZ2_9STRA|nr:unnamed protein product [Phytophthora fragariaefolia]